MPTRAKPPTAQEVSALEHAFAADPSSHAYRPLTEAYLAMGRFMEAMVVCKKGVKAHPDDPSARVLLARVFADQGKDRKALDELAAILAAYPTFAAANRMAGELHYRLGEKEQGEAAVPRHAPAPVAPRVAAPPMAPRVGVPSATRSAVVAAAAAAVAPAGDHTGITGELEITESAPVPTPVPRRRNVAYAEQLADKYATREYTLSTPQGKAQRKGKGRMLLATLGLAGALVVVLGGWLVWSRAHKATVEGIDRLLKETVPLVDKDSYPTYVAAAGKCKEILGLDDASVAGHAYLAYIDAIRATEHGDGDAVKAESVQHVEAARKQGQRHSHLVAAEAYLKLGAGDAAGAKAQKASAGDVRLSWLLAEQFRRRGEGYEAQAIAFYDYALRIQKDHVGSILGKALVLLARGQVEPAGNAAQAVLAPAAGASKPQLALANAIRGGVLAVQGKPEEAAAAEAEASKLDPSNADIPALVGQRKLRGGDAAGAVEALQRAVAIDSRRVSLYADLVRAMLAKEGGAKLAIETVKRATSRLGESPRLALLLGDAYRAAGDGDLAQGQYEKAVKLGNPFPDARVALARLYRAKNNLPGALTEIEQAITEYGQAAGGGLATAYVEKAEANRARGAKPDDVRALYVEALKADPVNCDALFGASKIDVDQHKLGDDGKRRLETFMKLCGRDPRAAEAARLGK